MMKYQLAGLMAFYVDGHPVGAPLTAPPTFPSNCAWAGAAPRASAEAAASMNLVMSFSF